MSNKNAKLPKGNNFAEILTKNKKNNLEVCDTKDFVEKSYKTKLFPKAKGKLKQLQKNHPTKFDFMMKKSCRSDLFNKKTSVIKNDKVLKSQTKREEKTEI